MLFAAAHESACGTSRQFTKTNQASIMRDAATAKPQLFLFDDAWFATNLISRLNQIDE